MARARRFTSGRTGSSSRRLTEWSEGPKNDVIQSITAAGGTLVSTGSEAQESLTTVRIRGEWVLWLEAVGTIGDGFSGVGLGIGIVSADAFAQGVAATPIPFNDADWGGWIWYHMMGPIVGFSVTESENTGPVSQVRVPIDSKAMRKTGPNEVLFGSIQTIGEVGAATLSFGMRTRILDKLS